MRITRRGKVVMYVLLIALALVLGWYSYDIASNTYLRWYIHP